MPTPDNIQEPTDLKLAGIQVTNEFLRKDYQEVLKMLRLHEQELALLWLLNCAIIIAMIYRGHRIEKMLKEYYDFGK